MDFKLAQKIELLKEKKKRMVQSGKNLIASYKFDESVYIPSINEIARQAIEDILFYMDDKECPVEIDTIAWEFNRSPLRDKNFAKIAEGLPEEFEDLEV